MRFTLHINLLSWHFVNSHSANIADVSLSENKNIPALIAVLLSLSASSLTGNDLSEVLTRKLFSWLYIPVDSTISDE
jgi:hypothetical protein